MSSCLRSTGSFVRLTRHSLSTASKSASAQSSRSVRSPQLWRPLQSRHYSQEPEKPTSSNSGKDQKDVSGAKDANQRTVGQQAPGLEHMYNEHSPLSKSTASEGPSQPPKLSPEDEAVLRDITDSLKKGMPKSQRDDFEKAVQAMYSHGIPSDLRDIMNKWKGHESMDLATAAKMIRIITRLSRKASEIRFERWTKEDSEEPAKEKSKEEGSQQNKQKEQGSFKFGGGNSPIPEFRIDIGTMVTSALVTYFIYSALNPGENSRQITWQEFRTQFLDRGLVSKLTVVNHKTVRVTLDREAIQSYASESDAARGNFYYYFTIGDVATFERHLDDAHRELQIPSPQRIPVSYEESTPWSSILLGYGPTLLLLGLPLMLLRGASRGGGMNSGLFGMGKSKAKKFNHETDIKIGFKDVAGMDEAKQEIMEFVSFLKEPGQYQKLGAKIPRGAILSGPPGTGKTLLAKATAGESGVPFFSVSGSEFIEMFVGVGASRVRDLFKEARKSTPCIIFIDEIDAIGKQRGRGMGGGGTDEREATLNQILTEMDGFNTNEQVVVMAGTNQVDTLDKALMRPGRFDRHIGVDRPTMDGRKQIFGVHLKKIVTNEDQDYLQGRLAALTPGFSGADIANACNEAALIAARNTASSVTMAHFESAIERVIGGLEKKSLVLNPEEKKVVAYHEAGHAICGWYFRYADPLLKVSIIPRGQGALGYAQYLPAGDTYLMNVKQLMDRMAMTLGGRVSEEIHFETVTSGASDDFNKVTRMATAMVTKWGMSSKIGYLYFEDDSSQQLHKPFSEETAKNIDLEVRRIVDEAHKQCKDLLTEKKKEVGLVAEELLSKEVLSRDDMVRILGPRPFEDNKDFTKYFGSRGDREGAPEPKPGESGEPGGPTGGPFGGGIGPTPAFKGQDEAR